MPGVLLHCSEHQAHRGTHLTGVLLCSSAHQSLKGVPWVGSYSVVQCIRHLMGQPLSCLAANAGIWGREFMVMALPLHMTQQDHLASMAARLSSTGISHYNLLPHIASTHLSTVNSSPHPGIAPQSLNSSSQLLHLPGESVSLFGVCMAVSRTPCFSFRLGCHRSVVSLSALNVSPLTQIIAPMWGSDSCFCSPTHQGQVQAY